MKPRRSRLLSHHILSSGTLEMEEEEIAHQLFLKEGPQLLLGRYTKDAIFGELRRVGLMEVLEHKGLSPVTVEIDTADPYHQKVLLLWKGKRIGEIILNIQRYHVKGKEVINAGLSEPFTALVVEWLMLEHPEAHWERTRHRFPGQRRPGLGIGRQVLHALVDMARDMGMDAIVAFPEFYHNSVLYSHFFKFLSPLSEGRFRAMMRDLNKYDLCDVSFAFSGGFIIEHHNGSTHRISWKAEEMVLAISPRLVHYFETPPYTTIVNKTLKHYAYDVDWEGYHRQEDQLKKSL